MKRSTLVTLLMGVVFAFTLAGCSGAQQMTDDTVKGAWVLEGSDMPFEVYLNFDDDGEAQLIMGEANLSGTWKISSSEGELSFSYYSYRSAAQEEANAEDSEVEKTAKFIYRGGKLILGNQNGSHFVFQKDDSEETQEMFELYGSSGATEATQEPVIESMDEVVIADDDKVKIAVIGKGTDEYGDPGYQLSITNKTSKEIYVQAGTDFVVQGKKTEYGAYLDEALDAGDSTESFMSFFADDVSDVSALKEIAGDIIIYDGKKYDDILDSTSESDEEIGTADDDTDYSPAEIKRYEFKMN